MIDTLPLLSENIQFPSIRKGIVDTFQVNLGYLCNQQCNHCHVNASPKRKEIMSKDIIDSLIDIVSKSQQIKTLDLTGGAPEMNPNFKYLVEAIKPYIEKVMVRSNLTILNEPGYEDFIDFFAAHDIEVIASLPCYLEDNVDSQRGKGVYEESIKALKALNYIGYGKQNSKLRINLVYNPTGAYLPPNQLELEKDYKKFLKDKHGIEFNQLYTITNMPIKRFGSTLVSKGEFNDYMDLLKKSYNKSSLESVMCQNIVSISWDGYMYDCDFNQMLDLKMQSAGGVSNIKDIKEWVDNEQPIVIANHCFACTAGQGSSCGGALV